MSDEASELLKKALGLPAGARAALASSLLESLDVTVDESAEEEWEQEIARRRLAATLLCGTRNGRNSNRSGPRRQRHWAWFGGADPKRRRFHG